VTQKPNDPEAFIRERFSDTKEALFRSEDSLALFVVPLCPLSLTAQLASAFAKPQLPCSVNITELGDGGVAGCAGSSEIPLPTEFTQCSPFSRVPALSHNGLGVVETGCLVRYLCGKSGDTGGAPLRQRVRIEVAFETVLNHFMPDASRWRLRRFLTILCQRS